MNAATSWPTNKYGTTWRRAVMYFDWQDEEIVAEAIETMSPLKITVRHHPVAAIGFKNITDMVLCRVAEPLPYGRNWNPDKLTIIIDPCADPDALASVVEEWMENVRFSVFGVSVLDFSDAGIYGALMDAFAERRLRFVGEYPVIEF